MAQHAARRGTFAVNGSTAGGRLAIGWPDRRRVKGWLAIFGVSLTAFMIRFLVLSPVAMADNGDGPRLMCAFGLGPVTGGHARYLAYAYFSYVRSPRCAGTATYLSSEHLLLIAAHWLTPVLGLSGVINLIALGVVSCVLVSAGIASMALTLASTVRGQIALAGALWLVMADATFFDVFASPYSEGAMLAGLLLVAAGVVRLSRSGGGYALGLLLAALGGFGVIWSKQQYVPLVIPICATLVLASIAPGRAGESLRWSGRIRRRSGRIWRRFGNRRSAAAIAVAAGLLVGAALYAHDEASSARGRALDHQYAVDAIFGRIVTGRDNSRADLSSLGLPASWARYAGTNYWTRPGAVEYSPLYRRYARRFTDLTIARFLVTHPWRIFQIGQQAADNALAMRVNYLGSYSPGAGQPAGAIEDRIGVVSSIVAGIPAGLGLFWLVPLWAAMAGTAIIALRRSRHKSWRRDAAFATLCLTGCAVAAFVPPAFFALATTKHMLGSNAATALAFPLAAALLGSVIREAISEAGRTNAGTAADPALVAATPASR